MVESEIFDMSSSSCASKPIDINKLTLILKKYLSFDTKPKTIQKLPLPENLKEQLLKEFQKLSEIPHYYIVQVKDQIQNMKKLCKGYDSPYLGILKKAEDAAAWSSEQIPDIIKEATKY